MVRYAVRITDLTDGGSTSTLPRAYSTARTAWQAAVESTLGTASDSQRAAMLDMHEPASCELHSATGEPGWLVTVSIAGCGKNHFKAHGVISPCVDPACPRIEPII